MKQENDLHLKSRKRLTRPDQPDKPDLPILLNPPKGNFVAEMVSNRLRRKIRYEVMGGLPFEEPIIYGPLRRVIHDFWAEMQVAMDWYRTELSDFLYGSGKKFSDLVWIRHDGKIMANLSERRNFRLMPMMDYLKASPMPFLQ